MLLEEFIQLLKKLWLKSSEKLWATEIFGLFVVEFQSKSFIRGILEEQISSNRQGDMVLVGVVELV